MSGSMTEYAGCESVEYRKCGSNIGCVSAVSRSNIGGVSHVSDVSVMFAPGISFMSFCHVSDVSDVLKNPCIL